MLYLYNTLTRQKEEFVPLKGNEVRMYCCGLTVYNYAHIGNLRSFLFEDILRRALEMNGYMVNHVMNITDVGHLAGDDGDDTGEDKMLKGAKRENKTVWDIAQFYIDEFLKDMKALNLLEPTHMPKATDHVQEMIELIKVLEKKGFTYEAGGNIYFDTEKFDSYKDFAKLPPVDQTQSRVAKDPNKKNQRDFALWFTKSKFDDQEMKWESPWGVGYPGWHIECSAMSQKYLGLHENLAESETFDIHCGGVDHIAVHHTNEIAQTECVTGRKMAKYWLHNEFVGIGESDKMAKSAGNFIRLKTLQDKNFNAMGYRYFVLGAHYRSKLKFTWEALQAAHNALYKIYTFLDSIYDLQEGEVDQSYNKEFQDAINDDLNTPQALAVLWALIKDLKVSGENKKATLLKFDEVLGFNLDMAFSKIPEEVVELAKKRLIAKENKDYETADHIREEIKSFGFQIEDIGSGWNLKRLR